MKWLVAVALALVTSPARAGIEWDRQSIKRVYDPRGQFYCYAPALVREEGADVVFACHNTTAGIVRDDVVLIRRGAGDEDLTTRSVLTAAPGDAWDSFHICDPSVVSGVFRLHGVAYRHAMFYLGNNADACINNQVGVAFANSWEGPWQRLGPPLVAYPQCGHWGAGQPSAVYDGNGRLLLFYTKASPRAAGYVREVNLGAVGGSVLGAETPLTTDGLTSSDGHPDYWNNFDVAYDAKRNRFWAIRERHPYPADEPSNISRDVEVLSISGDDLWREARAWKVEGHLTPEVTGHARNHNACFARDARGALPDPSRIRVIFSTSRAGAQIGDGSWPLWTYELWEISGILRDKP